MTCRGVCKCLCGVFDLTYCIHSLTLQHHIRSHSLSQSTHTPVAICHIDSLIALPARRKCPEGQQNHRSHIGSLRSHRSQRRGRKSGRGRRRSQNLEFAIWAERERERERDIDGQTGRRTDRPTATQTNTDKDRQAQTDAGFNRSGFWERLFCIAGRAHTPTRPAQAKQDNTMQDTSSQSRPWSKS